jgi:hypothetical protein
VKTIVLDDDPTGTQSASGVRVLLDSDADLLTEALREAEPAVVDTERALDEPESAGAAAAKSALAQLDTRALAVLVTERDRLADHGTLDHGERIMTALTAAVQAVLPEVSVVVAKGGITSAEVARNGIGATSALVLGQILPGISVWQKHARDHRAILLAL